MRFVRSFRRRASLKSTYRSANCQNLRIFCILLPLRWPAGSGRMRMGSRDHQQKRVLRQMPDHRADLAGQVAQRWASADRLAVRIVHVVDACTREVDDVRGEWTGLYHPLPVLRRR